MEAIVGKWKSGSVIYEFNDTGFFDSYSSAERSHGIMGRYSVIGGRSLKLSTPLSDNTLGFSVYGNTLTLYPDDGGSPIVFERTY